MRAALTSRHVAFVSYGEVPLLTADDALAVAALTRRGVTATVVSWSDPAVNWSEFDAIVFRSCWDYFHHPSGFARWLVRIRQQNILSWNPIEVVQWNQEKTYLRGLEEAGVPIVSSAWIAQGEPVELSALLSARGWEVAVIKPTISGTALHTWTTSPATRVGDQANLDHLLRTRAMMVQEYLPEIVSAGEWSVIFFGGAYSHAVRKKPASGDFRVQSDFGGTWIGERPSPGLIAQAARVLEVAGHDLLYARVDGVERGGTFLLMELEVIEPALFLAADDGAPDRFARELRRRI